MAKETYYSHSMDIVEEEEEEEEEGRDPECQRLSLGASPLFEKETEGWGGTV